jgi:hypothetical protein
MRDPFRDGFSVPTKQQACHEAKQLTLLAIPDGRCAFSLKK